MARAHPAALLDQAVPAAHRDDQHRADARAGRSRGGSESRPAAWQGSARGQHGAPRSTLPACGVAIQQRDDGEGATRLAFAGGAFGRCGVAVTTGPASRCRSGRSPRWRRPDPQGPGAVGGLGGQVEANVWMMLSALPPVRLART